MVKTQMFTKLKTQILTTKFLTKLKNFWFDQLDTSTTDEMHLGQRFAILAMFLLALKKSQKLLNSWLDAV